MNATLIKKIKNKLAIGCIFSCNPWTFVIDFGNSQPLNAEMDGFKSKMLNNRTCISIHKTGLGMTCVRETPHTGWVRNSAFIFNLSNCIP